MIRGREQRKDKSRRKQNNDILGKLCAEKKVLRDKKRMSACCVGPKEGSWKEEMKEMAQKKAICEVRKRKHSHILLVDWVNLEVPRTRTTRGI